MFKKRNISSEVIAWHNLVGIQNTKTYIKVGTMMVETIEITRTCLGE